MKVESDRPKLPEQFSTIDLARGLCAAWVLVGHAFMLCQFEMNNFLQPAFAVDVFMAVSGFLMCRHFIERRSKEPWEFASTWCRFWARRFFRLAPVYYFLLTIYFLFQPVFLHNVENLTNTTFNLNLEALADRGFWNVLTHFTFTFGLSPFYSDRALAVDWSLGLEAQFYFAFPFLMLIFSRAGWIAGACFAISLAALLCISFPDYTAAFSEPSTLILKLHVFLAGIFGAIAITQKQKNMWLIIATVTLVAALPFPDSGASWKTPRDRAVYVLLFLVIVAIETRFSQTFPLFLRFCKSRLVRFAADTSYGVYLVHSLVNSFLVNWLLRYHLGRETRVVILLATCVPITYALAWLIHLYIEKPGISLGRRFLGYQLESPRLQTQELVP